MMKALVITVMILAIAFLWLLTNILYKPSYDRIKREYVIDEPGMRLANLCIVIMLSLSLAMGLLI
jgi:hypothetical protein